jgi:DNA-binding IscR family transcriptional regulator
VLAAVERYILERKKPVTAKQIAEYFLISPSYVRELCRILAKESVEVTRKNGRNYYTKRD